MAHFAELDQDNICLRVLVFDNNEVMANGGDWSPQAEQWIIDNNTPFTTVENSITGKEGIKWKQTSFNTHGGKHYSTNEAGVRSESADQSKAKRFRYAGLKAIYDEARDAFLPEQPYSTWVFNNTTLDYDPPVSRPTVELITVDGVEVLLSFSWDNDKITWRGDNTDQSIIKYWNPNTNSWEDDYGS